jgi:pimeloyl-ACP methyl ester carboxylesterase
MRVVRRSRWRQLWREAEALRRQSTLLPRKLRTRGVALRPEAGAVDVVYVLHGFLATAGVFELLERRLYGAGVEHVASFTYGPLRTVDSLARQLRDECERMPAGVRLHLVGHSLGGLVARYYVQEEGGRGRVRQTISLASPFHGTSLGRYLPPAIEANLSPESPLLARLRDPARAAPDVPHLSVVAADDLLVRPATSAAFPGGDVEVLDDVGHNGLLFDSRVADLVCARVVAADEADARPG